MNGSGLAKAASVVGAAAVGLGWVAVAVSVPGNVASGIVWMVVFAGAATAALAGFLLLRRSGHPGWATACYALVALAPTTFAYPVNLLVVVIAALLAVSVFRSARSATRFARRAPGVRGAAAAWRG